MEEEEDEAASQEIKYGEKANYLVSWAKFLG